MGAGISARPRGLAWALAFAAVPPLACGPPAAEPAEATDGATTEASTDSDAPSGSRGEDPTVALACTPGEVRPCYEGPPGTEGVGLCRAGEQACDAEGAAWSACEGAVEPAAAESCETPGDDDCDGSVTCEPTLAWVHEPVADVRRVAAAPDGHVVLAGYAYDTVLDGRRLDGSFVLELDAEGQVQWARTVPDVDPLEIRTLTVDAQGRITMAGGYYGAPDLGGGPLPPSFGSSAFAVRYDADGEYLWTATLPVESFLGAAVGPDGTTYVLGFYIYLDVDGEITNGDFFVAAIDDAGAMSWLRTGSGAFGVSDEGPSIAVDGAGRVVTAWPLYGNDPEVELAGMPLSVESLTPVLVRLDATGAPLDHVVVEIDGQLSDIDRLRVFPGPDDTMSLVANVAYSVEGQYSTSGLLAQYDATLRQTTSALVGDPLWFQCVGARGDGHFVVGFNFSDRLELGPLGVATPTFTEVGAFAEVDTQGNARWLEIFPVIESVAMFAATVTTDGSVVLSGNSTGPISLGGTLIYDRFVAKLRL